MTNSVAGAKGGKAEGHTTLPADVVAGDAAAAGAGAVPSWRGSVAGGTLWCAIGGLVALGAGGGTSALDPGYLLLCALLVLAPACVAVPAGRVLRAPIWALETICSWAALGYLLLFVDPRALGDTLALALVVAALFGALASPALIWAAWFTPRRAARRRSRQQGYLVATTVCGVVLLGALGAGAPLNLGLLGLIAASGQGLLLAGGREPAAPPAPGRGSGGRVATARKAARGGVRGAGTPIQSLARPATRGGDERG